MMGNVAPGYALYERHQVKRTMCAPRDRMTSIHVLIVLEDLIDSVLIYQLLLIHHIKLSRGALIERLTGLRS